MRTICLPLCLILLLSFPGCRSGGATTGLNTSPGPTGPLSVIGGPVSYSRDIQPIFLATCSCHQNAAGAGGLSLEPGNSYKNMVNVKSGQSLLLLVAPGAPDQSYLIYKLVGNQFLVGGSGNHMPTGTSLSPEQLDLIRLWISSGAAQ